MATANFYSMENFPLYVKETDSMDNFDVYELCSCVTERIMEFEEDNELKFHKISLRDGYYTGIQFWVEDTEDFGKYMDDFTNEDCHYYYDMCRSKAIRAYNGEVTKINRFIKKLAKEYGFKKLNILGRFSNGEVVYRYE